MSTGKKVRVAFFDFTGCEGCQLAKISMENELLGILQHIDIVNFREAMTEASWDFDVAFVEGSISSTMCVERIIKSGDMQNIWWPWAPARQSPG